MKIPESGKMTGKGKNPELYNVVYMKHAYEISIISFTGKRICKNFGII